MIGWIERDKWDKMPKKAERSAERVRLSDHFSKIQVEVSACQVLLSADGHPPIATAYAELVAIARGVVGRESRNAWLQEPIGEDSAMNMGELFSRLERHLAN